jgi:uncharacterized protein (DUF2147 family)
MGLNIVVQTMRLLQSMLLLFITAYPVFVLAGNAISPIGLWKTYDDDGEPSGYVEINEAKGIYTGVIEKGLPTDKEDKYCTLCKDERKDQKLIGLTIIKNVKAKDGEFSGGEILDPFSGNTYNVKLKLKEAGQKLEVRGFLGISLFGRTQVWQRTDAEE